MNLQKADSARMRAWGAAAACMALAAAFLMIGSKSSPLYPMNDWVDMHCFFTVGRGWREGLLPYRDLVEQKGPILYAVYALISMISSQSFIGVYLLESVTLGLFLFMCTRIMQLYAGRTRVIWPALTLLMAQMVLSKAFCHGGSLEETTIFIPAWSLYAMLRAQKEGRLLHRGEVLLHGVLCGVCLMTKYTICGFYLGLALALLIWYARSRAWKELPAVIGWFALGNVLVCGVCAAYFAAHGALKDLWTGYFYNNIFLYTKVGGGEPLLQAMVFAVFSAFSGMMLHMGENPMMALLIGVGFVYLALRAKDEPLALVTAALSFCGLVFFTYFTGWSCTYYAMVMQIYTVFGLLPLILLAQAAARRFRIRVWMARGAVAALLLVSLVQVYRKSDNTYLMRYHREEMPQYRFAQIIGEKEDATLLNYGFLDGGFYYAAGVTPTCPYFCRLMADIPQMMQVQNTWVKEGKTDFLILQNQTLSDLPWIDTGLYELVDQAQFFFENDWPTYYLYRLKS